MKEISDNDDLDDNTVELIGGNEVIMINSSPTHVNKNDMCGGKRKVFKTSSVGTKKVMEIVAQTVSTYLVIHLLLVMMKRLTKLRRHSKSLRGNSRLVMFLSLMRLHGLVGLNQVGVLCRMC